MPFDNVTIEAEFVKESVVESIIDTVPKLINIVKNPETGDKILLIIISIVTSLLVGITLYMQKK